MLGSRDDPRKRPKICSAAEAAVQRPKVDVAVHAAKAVFAVPRWYTRYSVVDTHPIHTADAFYATNACNYGANSVAIINMSKFVHPDVAELKDKKSRK